MLTTDIYIALTVIILIGILVLIWVVSPFANTALNFGLTALAIGAAAYFVTDKMSATDNLTMASGGAKTRRGAGFFGDLQAAGKKAAETAAYKSAYQAVLNKTHDESLARQAGDSAVIALQTGMDLGEAAGHAAVASVQAKMAEQKS